MFRRLFTLAVVAAASLALASPALAARVHVRVEGMTQTIFGATEPVVEATNALEALEAASRAGEFYYRVQTSAFGPYVDQIARYPAASTTGWVFKVNGVSPPVGADKVVLKDGDRVLWYWATFGPTGGPPTLRLERRGRRCYRVLAEDETGKTRPATGAVLVVDGKRVRTRAGSACLKAHRGLVRATLPGAVRSNALP